MRPSTEARAEVYNYSVLKTVLRPFINPLHDTSKHFQSILCVSAVCLQVLYLRQCQMLNVCWVIVIEDLPGEAAIDFWVCLKGDDCVGMRQQHLVAFCKLNKTRWGCIDFSNMELRCRLVTHIC